MAVPDLKTQRQADLSLLSAPDLPWVVQLTVPGFDETVPARIRYPEDDTERAEIQRDTAWVKVKKSDWPDPQYRDPVDIDATTWHVAVVVEDGSSQWLVRLSRDMRVVFG